LGAVTAQEIKGEAEEVSNVNRDQMPPAAASSTSVLQQSFAACSWVVSCAITGWLWSSFSHEMMNVQVVDDMKNPLTRRRSPTANKLAPLYKVRISRVYFIVLRRMHWISDLTSAWDSQRRVDWNPGGH